MAEKAFPLATAGGKVITGMDLRDYFAAHAPVPNQEMPLADHCEYRYRYADAMIAARAK